MLFHKPYIGSNGLSATVLFLFLFLESVSGVCARPIQETDLRFHHITTMDGLSQPSVSTILQDQSGFLWFGTQNGLTRYDGYEMKVYRRDPGDPYALTNNDILSLYEDEAGRLWIGTALGLNVYDRGRDQFITYMNEPYNLSSLSDDNIWDIQEDRHGYIWVATQDGLNRLDVESGRFKRFYHDPDDTNSLSGN
ncbi:two-component regulator propeller domain-containing protein, partial [Balneolaceae bacterium ANBcel3]|nr:two-component regulator propeller domain-containing protein [Balneolaceae bacterium ANBcel3]